MCSDDVSDEELDREYMEFRLKYLEVFGPIGDYDSEDGDVM